MRTPGGNFLAKTKFSIVRVEMPKRAESDFLLKRAAVIGVMSAVVMISLKSVVEVMCSHWLFA